MPIVGLIARSFNAPALIREFYGVGQQVCEYGRNLSREHWRRSQLPINMIVNLDSPPISSIPYQPASLHRIVRL